MVAMEKRKPRAGKEGSCPSDGQANGSIRGVARGGVTEQGREEQGEEAAGRADMLGEHCRHRDP